MESIIFPRKKIFMALAVIAGGFVISKFIRWIQKRGSSDESNQEALDEGSPVSSTQPTRAEHAESTHPSAHTEKSTTSPTSSHPAQSGMHIQTDVIHVTAESKKEDGKDGTGKPVHVMISYNWGVKEEGFPCQQRMKKLRDELIADNYRVWMDLVDMDGNMDDRMAEAVENAYVILMCVSEKYQTSPNCKKEAQYAFFLKKPIVILKYDRHTPTGWLGLQINNLLYYDVQTEEAMMKNLPKIKEQLDKDKAPTKQADHDPENKKGLINGIAKELRKHYMGHICKKRVYPWDQTGKWMDFDKIYVPVTIDRDVGPETKPIKESLESYEELFKIEEDEVSRRFLLVGDPGQGKSSFCAKVAHDWCVGTTLNNIRLLFIIDLAKVNKDTDVEDAICKNLLSNMDIQPSKLNEVIQHLKQSVFFIFDGLDEAPKLWSNEDVNQATVGNNRVTDVIKDQKLKDCRVLVTTRPWGEEQMRNIPGYKRLELKKMTRENVKKYIKKFFGQERKALGDQLLEVIDGNKLTLDTSTPLIVLLMLFYWSETDGREEIPDQLRTLYDKIIDIMYKKQQGMLAKKKMIRKLGEMSAKTLTTNKTQIVFTKEEAILELGDEGILVQCQKCGILCDKGTGSLQFFHKSGQEFCAGVYLSENPDKLSEYLKEIEEVQEALNLGLVLVFAAGSNKEAAKTIVKKLVELFTTDDCCNKYYSVKDDKERHPVLNYEQSRQVQRLIELLLECYYEGQIGDEMRDSLKPVFLKGHVLFTGLTQKLVSSVSYYMRYCGEDVKEIHLHPIPHVKEDMEEIEKGAMRQVFADTVKAMEKRDISDLKRQCDRYVTANEGTVSEDISTYHRLAFVDTSEHSHLFAVHLAAYISCLEITAGLPSSNEVDITPIINNLHKTMQFNNLFKDMQTLNCGELFETVYTGYFAQGITNRSQVLDQVINHVNSNPSISNSLDQLDASQLHCSTATVTRVMKSIPKMINLHKLDISQNEFEPGVTSSVLANSLTQCTQLQEFNMIGMEGATSSDMNTIFTAFTFLVSLRKLNISRNPLPNVDSVKCLRKCQALEQIDLEGMKGEEDEMAAFITTAGELPQLTTLKLFANDVINGSKCFSAIISILPHLRILDLGAIKFTKERLETLISTSRNTSMQKLT
ncbi:uncharacterized protein [Amphiura filiformis]|uniref:uncharacterized protein n=1 Tax=Amphiura filiformis TaxID=82378 RepID=UPI003B20D656